jgi:hypothetical protein
MRPRAVVGAVALAMGCAPHPEPAAPVAELAPGSVVEEDLPAALGQRVSVVGVARDARMGAVVLLADTPVYVVGLDAWPTELHGQRVRVEGRVEERKLAPDPSVGPDGAQTAGMEGVAWVLAEATWRRDAP